MTLTAAVKPTADSDVMYTAIGVGVGVGAALLVLVTTTVVLTAWCVKKNRSKRGTYNIYMD